MSPAETSDSPGIAASKSAPWSNGSTPVSHSHLRFGLYEVDLQKCELRKGGLKLKIPHQSFQVLALLLQKPGEVVSRETLRQELWPSDVFVNFEGSLNSAVQKLRSVLQDTSREPRYIETIPRVGYRFIADVDPLLPVSTKAPDDTAGSGRAGLPALDAGPDEKTLVDLSKVSAAPDRRLHYGATAIFLLLVVAVAIYAGYRYSLRSHVGEIPGQPSRGSSSSVVSPTHARRSVAILGFANVAGDAHNQWLSTAFSEMLATELAAGDTLRTVAGEHVARAKLELTLPTEDSYAQDTLNGIHKDLGCDYVVTGSYVAIGQEENGRLRLDARVQDALTGDTVANVAVAGTRRDLFSLASRAGEQLRAKLGLGVLTDIELGAAKISLPSDPEAAKLYSEGLAKLRVYDDVEAGSLFERAIRLQPEYAPAYSALASAWSALGYDAKAAVVARKAMDLSRNLPERMRLETEARYYKVSADWTKEAEAYSRLQRLYPDDLDYGLNIALAQNAMGSSREAAATIAALQKSPLVHNDPRIELTEAGIAGELADYKREQTLAESAAQKSETAGERLLLARAKMIVGYAANDLGNFKSAIEAFSIAERMCADSGDAVGAALAKMNIGISLWQQGDLSAAERDFQQALDVFRKKGDQASMAAALTNLSEIYRTEDDLPKAERFIRESMAISTRLNRTGKLDIEKSNLADSLRQQGKFREAKEVLEPLIEHLRSAGKKTLLGSALEISGSIAETEGDLPAALRMYQEAAGLFKDTSDNPDYAVARRSLGELLLRTADFAGAKQSLSEALSVDRTIGAETNVDLDEVGLAELSIAQGVPVDVTALRSRAADLRVRKISDGEVGAEVVLVRELIREGKTSEAASVLREATALSARCYDPTLRFDVALATAQLQTAQHRFSAARRTIQPALQRAAAIGCVRCELEGRLELGEIEIQAGNAEKGRALLRQLADEAEKRGFRLIAQLAAADSVSSPVPSANLSGRDSKANPLR